MLRKLLYFCTVGEVRNRRAFTLVEMLAVMAIIVVMLLVALPAFSGFNQGESRRGAAANLMAVLDRARMMAVSDNLPTYVVFADKISGGSQQVNPNLWGRAYAIFQDQDNVTFNVTQRTPWLYLPNNVAFKTNGQAAVAGDGSGNGSDESSVTCITPVSTSNYTDPTFVVTGSALPSGTTGSLSVQLPYWKFANTGAVDPSWVSAHTGAGQPQNPLRALMFTGYVDGNGNEVSTQRASTKSNTNGVSNQAAQLLEEVDVNQVTGRAKYIVDPFNNLATPTPTPTS